MKIIAHNVRQAYMTYFDAKVIGTDKKGPSFSTTVIVDAESRFTIKELNLSKVGLKEVAEACKKVIIAKNGKTTPKDKNWFLSKADGSTTRDAYVDDNGDYLDGFSEEAWLLSGKKYPGDIAKSKCGQFDARELYIVDKAKQRITAQDGNLKPGDRVNVVFDVYAFAGDEAKGCTASVEGVQKWADGPALKLGTGSGGVSDDDFEAEEMPEEGNDAADLM